jgi:hypothetical protein
MRWLEMRNSDLDLIALLTKGLCDLRSRFDKLARDPGPAGRDGKDGRNGDDGLPGARGARGARGAQGPQGEVGPRGAKGEKGEKGDTGPMPAHEWQGTKLRFEKPEGGWGDLVELRGPKGARGDRGPGGAGGAAGAVPPFDIDSLPAATSAVPAEFLVQQSGQWARASYAQMQAWFPSGLPVGSVTVDGEPVMVNGEYVKVT